VLVALEVQWTLKPDFDQLAAWFKSVTEMRLCACLTNLSLNQQLGWLKHTEGLGHALRYDRSCCQAWQLHEIVTIIPTVG
jgi:hypothetical protein